jgi:Lamin Tail Domain
MRIAVALLMTLGMALVGLVTVPLTAAQASSRIVIHEIYYNSPGRDTGSNWSLNHEWVQLHNRTDHRITLTHWTLRDRQGHVYKFGTYRLKAHGYVKIHTGKGTNTQTNRYWRRSWYVWNNTGDRATLKNANGNVVDRCTYDDPHEDHAYKIC